MCFTSNTLLQVRAIRGLQGAGGVLTNSRPHGHAAKFFPRRYWAQVEWNSAKCTLNASVHSQNNRFLFSKSHPDAMRGPRWQQFYVNDIARPPKSIHARGRVSDAHQTSL